MSPICIYSVLRIVFFQDKHSTTTQARVSECHSVSSRAASLKFLVRIKYKVWPVFFTYFHSSFSAYFRIAYFNASDRVTTRHRCSVESFRLRQNALFQVSLQAVEQEACKK